MGWQVNLQHIEPANSIFFAFISNTTVQEEDMSSINDLVIVIIECIPYID